MPVNIQVYASGLQYAGDITNQWWTPAVNWGGGVSFNQYLNRCFDGGLHMSYGKTSTAAATLAANENVAKFDARVGTAMYGIRLKLHGLRAVLDQNPLRKVGYRRYGFRKRREAIVGPYLMLAAGMSFVDTKSTNAAESAKEKYVTGTLFGGAGVNIRLTRAANVFLQTGRHWAASDSFDGVVGGEKNDHFLQHTFGIGFNLGGGKSLTKLMR
ncbi:hypothetical protein [Pontibacter sp. SGAir0037]|uniref:hypothetical protein n=1 Tax=Pontibacter sp. SGAir0037 TaxID=2571030 RepID=UPI0010CCED2E|nr:hypothetical protein [Pontibacter sp. SGAir0037]QCR24553.1 hypothetical protein C1N53_20790 [Pontibacter sp. SGAir0037]